MKVQFHILGYNASAGLRHRLEEMLEEVQSLISVSDAAVVLEHERDKAPAFRVFVLLAVPGPDIHAEARDHTLEATWLKVITGLRRQIQQRKSRHRPHSETAHQEANQPRINRKYFRHYNGVISPTYSTAHSIN